MLFAVREWRNAPNTAPIEERFYAWTTNGGQQWQTHATPAFHPRSSVFPLDTNRWARFVGSKNQVGNLPECAFDMSDDHGQTWVRRRSWMPVVAGFCEFWDAQHGIVLGRPWEPEIPIRVDSGSYVTSDGGETWERWRSISGCFTAARFNDSVLRYFKWVSQIRACRRRDRSWRCNCVRIDSLAPVYAPVGSCC